MALHKLSPFSNHSTSRHLVYVCLILILGVLYLSLSYRDVLFAADEGATAYHFEKCLEGELQHRDFYSIYGTGFYILGKNLFELFGAKLIVLRIFVFILKILMALLIYLLALYLARPFFAFLGALGFIVWWGDPFIATPVHLYPSHINHLLGFLSLLLVFFYLRSERKLFIFLAGMVIGFGTLFKPTMAIFNLLGLFLFFYIRELLLDITGEDGHEVTSIKRSLGQAGIILELLVSMGGMVMLTVLFEQYGLNLPGFFYFLLPMYCILAFQAVFAFRSLRLRDSGALIWRNTKETYIIYALLTFGIIFWQVVQVLYFVRVGALSDFVHTYTTTSYYSNYSFPLWNGWIMVLVSVAALLLIAAFRTAFRTTALKGKWTPVIAGILLMFSAAPAILWLIFLDISKTFHISVWSISLPVILAVSLFLASEGSGSRLSSASLPSVLNILLITIYAAVELLDAFPKADIGHISMVLPPFLILMAVILQCFYDSTRRYLANRFPDKGGLLAGITTGTLAISVFLPSLFMMVLFEITLVPSSEGLHFYHGKMALVPRYRPAIARARPLALHMIEGYYWAPLADPKLKSFFQVAERLDSITKKGDKIFSTMTSSLMLYFLADRDGVWDKANCYVWQTVEGTTTSKAFEDFSDQDLVRVLEQDAPKAVVVEEESIETKRFIANWPYAWNFIILNYRPSDKIGPFLIYTPKESASVPCRVMRLR